MSRREREGIWRGLPSREREGKNPREKKPLSVSFLSFYVFYLFLLLRCRLPVFSGDYKGATPPYSSDLKKLVYLSQE